MWIRDALPGALALSVLAFAADSAAQPSSPQAQFDRGLADMLAGRFETGCPALAASQKADPRPGTLFTLGECELRWGHSASALRHLVSYLDAVVKLPSASDRELQADRVKLATTQRTDLERLVGHVTLEIPEGLPPDAVVRADGEPIERASLTAPFAVDPGDHLFEVVLPDGRRSEQAASVRKGEQRRVTLSVPGAAVADAVNASGPAPVASPGPRESRPSSPSSFRTWTWISGGIGATGIVVGSVAGVVALTNKTTAGSSCGTGGLSAGQCTSQQGVDAGNAAHRWADIATVGFGVGAAGLATAVVLWLLAPSATASANSWRPTIDIGSDLRWVGAVRNW